MMPTDPGVPVLPEPALTILKREATHDIGIVSSIAAKREAVLASNRLDAYARARITGKATAWPCEHKASVVIAPPLPRQLIAPAGKIKPLQVVETVAEIWGVTVWDICGRSHFFKDTLPRHASMLLMKIMLDMSYSAIARRFGRNDHMGVVSSVKRARWLYENNPDWRAKFDAAKAALAHGAPT